MLCNQYITMKFSALYDLYVQASTGEESVAREAAIKLGMCQEGVDVAIDCALERLKTLEACFAAMKASDNVEEKLLPYFMMYDSQSSTNGDTVAYPAPSGNLKALPPFLAVVYDSALWFQFINADEDVEAVRKKASYLMPQIFIPFLKADTGNKDNKYGKDNKNKKSGKDNKNKKFGKDNEIRNVARDNENIFIRLQTLFIKSKKIARKLSYGQYITMEFSALYDLYVQASTGEEDAAREAAIKLGIGQEGVEMAIDCALKKLKSFETCLNRIGAKDSVMDKLNPHFIMYNAQISRDKNQVISPAPSGDLKNLPTFLAMVYDSVLWFQFINAEESVKTLKERKGYQKPQFTIPFLRPGNETENIFIRLQTLLTDTKKIARKWSMSHPEVAQLPVSSPRPQAPELPVSSSRPQAPELPVSSSLPQAPELPVSSSLPQAPESPVSSSLPQAPESPASSSLPQAREDISPPSCCPCLWIFSSARSGVQRPLLSDV